MLAIMFVGAAAYTLPTAPRSLAVSNAAASRILMSVPSWNKNEATVPGEPVWNDPREGKPFGDADRDESKGGSRIVGGVRNAVESYQPRGVSDATVLKPQYIETEDEPWHATCRPLNVITKADLQKGMSATLPFVAPEDALGDATRKAKDAAAVSAALETAMKDGARKGSPAVVAAEKVLAAFEKGDDEKAEKAKPKAPKPPGAQGKGWDDMARAVGKTHDNSVA